MAWKVFLIGLGVGMGLALGDTPEPDKNPDEKPKVIDLDFTGDDVTWISASRIAADRGAPGRWLYWTLGAGAVAAGGIGWYLIRDGREPAAIRNEQIFTDER